jgi:hypothetical protein
MKVYIVRVGYLYDSEGSANVHSVYLNKEKAETVQSFFQQRSNELDAVSHNDRRMFSQRDYNELHHYYEVEEWDVIE